MIKIPEEVIPVLQAIVKEDGLPYLVGGAVRDYLLDKEPKDFDFEVFHLESGQLMSVLSKFGKVELVGKSFGILNLTLENGIYQFAIPRTEVKTTQGRKGFQVLLDPFMSVYEAQKRRDFTINAIYIDIISWLRGKMNYIDNHNGIVHLNNKILKHVSDRFSEDPLRVLRGFRFGGLGFVMDSETVNYCRSIIHMSEEISNERVVDEILKWAKTPYPAMGLAILEQTNWLLLFPTLVGMIGVEQDKEHHPEGDVWVHTALCVDEAANIATRLNLSDEDRQVLVMSALLHDCGKPLTTITSEGRIKSPKHDFEGAELSFIFLKTLGFSNLFTERVTELVDLHMWHVRHTVNEKSVRKLMARLKYNNIQILMALMEADKSARPPLPKGLPEKLKKVLEIAEQQKDKIQPIILGRHIEELGFTGAKWFGDILKVMYERQLEGKFNNLEEGKSQLADLVKHIKGLL